LPTPNEIAGKQINKRLVRINGKRRANAKAEYKASQTIGV